MTEKFSADWLRIREPYDAAARSRELATKFLATLPTLRRIVDLGAGEGANARYLEEINSVPSRWRLVDRDVDLLQHTTGLCGAIETQHVDFGADPALIDFTHGDAVTASAFFDLVSRDWFSGLVEITKGLPFLFALTVDGEFEWQPTDPSDPMITAYFVADMRRDKGFGPAMGAAAPKIMTSVMVRAGYRVWCRPSPWRLGPNDTKILTNQVELFANVARQRGERRQIEAWRERRLNLASARELRLVVGHTDILALPINFEHNQFS
jgi:hypothetical protein